MHLPFESVIDNSRYIQPFTFTWTFHIAMCTYSIYFSLFSSKLSLAVVYDEHAASFINVYDNELMNINEMKLTEKMMFNELSWLLIFFKGEFIMCFWGHRMHICVDGWWSVVNNFFEMCYSYEILNHTY